jgi:hypothetical protein
MLQSENKELTMPLLIECAVGFMLKVLKNGLDTSIFKNEFNAIRHGDYFAFITIVGSEIPAIAIYSKGKIRTQENNINFEFDFEGLIKSGPSLKKFLLACQKHYGIINDKDLPDDIFHKCAYFEIALRMHANNSCLLSKNERTPLETVINVLCAFKGVNFQEIEILHEGRKFVNSLKHQKSRTYNFKIEVTKFENAYQILEKWDILIV